MPDVLLESRENGVARLVLNRPDSRNALSGELTDALLAALARLADAAEVGAVVLSGAGPAFCAGGDVKAMTARVDAAPSFEQSARDLVRRAEITRLLHEMPKPTIAMINGPAMGAGMAIALACDLRLAGPAARFGTAFGQVGLPGDFGAIYFLTKAVGPAKARELFFTAAVVDASTALTMGMVNRVVPDAELEAETLALAQRLADGPRVALGYMKANLNAAMRGASLAEVLEAEALTTARAFTTEDHREATRAFVEKRPPQFRGR
jgi:2-(1,2-epoxy-1,2-dihydrophenyl)acetyl-CoA isomerase